MHRRKLLGSYMGVVAAVVAVAALAIVPVASAHTGEWAKFNNCPSKTAGVAKCLQAVVTKGEVILGKKKVPVVNKVTLQGGLSEPNGEGFRSMYAATNGETLTKAAQPVPGGLAGFVNCKEISNFIVRLGCEAAFENGLTGLNATLELAKPAGEVKVNESNLAFEEETALQMPVKVHLENPLLGSTCYIGSSSAPLLWNLTTGITAPPAGTAPITGSGGAAEFKENFELLQINNADLVDNGWSAPTATGCGGPIVELILDPIVNSSVGLPSAAGKNVANLTNTISLATTTSVNAH